VFILKLILNIPGLAAGTSARHGTNLTGKLQAACRIASRRYRFRMSKSLAITPLPGIALAGVLFLALAACGGGTRTLEPGQKLKVMAANPALASLAMAIAGDTADVEMLPPADKTTHDYSPTVDDRRRLESAHLFLVNGLGLESYDAAAVARAARVTLVDCSRGLAEPFLIRAEAEEPGKPHDHGHGHSHGAHNPHLWLCTEGAITLARAIEAAFAATDKANAASYRIRLGELETRLLALRDRYKPRIEALARREFVSNHDAFPYFAREFGLRQVGVIQRTPGTNPTLAERRALEDKLRKGGAAAIFLEPGYDDATSKAIAEASGLKLAVLDPFDSGKPGPRALEEVLERNLQTVLATLGE
jgi:ABC-type Zn uptake system ZnuABC Zn-binding protein ZnuA